MICAASLGLTISAYVCTNDELTKGRLNASNYEESPDSKVELDEDDFADEIQDRVSLYDDLDLNYQK